jgi:polyhydroxyalkanoate synthesis regulator phasin
MTTIQLMKDKATVATEMARKVGLAGLGATVMGYEETKGRFETLSKQSSQLFAELVKNGEKIETEGKVKLNDAKAKVSSKVNFDAKVAEVRTKLGLDKPSADQKIEELNAKIDALTAAVAKLA